VASKSAPAAPIEPEERIVSEPECTAEVEHRFLPAWAKATIPERLGTNYLTVRRVVDPSNAMQRNSLRSAFEVSGGTIELVDNGPFGEDDLRLRGDARSIRAAAGLRPIIKIDAPKIATVVEQPAVIVLENEQPFLDGLDLILNVQDLPRSQNALFLCLGTTLSLRNRTLTVSNPNATPFTLVRSQGGSPSRIRLETTLVRGAVLSLLDVPEGGVEFAADRSMLVGVQGPLLTFAGVDSNAVRRTHLSRSILASKGTMLDINGNRLGGRPSPLMVRALGSTFARLTAPGAGGGSAT
jgi:eukaryotic-like serine/threonine-protein kinase